MLDVDKLNPKIKLEIILLWVENMKERKVYTTFDKIAISVICDYILKEVSK